MKKNIVIIILAGCLVVTTGLLVFVTLGSINSKEIKAEKIEYRGTSHISREHVISIKNKISGMDEFELDQKMALKLGDYALRQAYGEDIWDFSDTLIIQESSDGSCYIVSAESPTMRERGMIYESFPCVTIDKKTAEIINIGI